MSNNNTNQNNNERHHNNRGGHNFNNRKKVNKQPKVNPNEIKVPLYLPADLDENIINEINNVLTTTKFDKISIPLGTYRCLIDSNVDADDARVSTIGYIRKYDAETEMFTVVIFSNFIDFFKAQSDNVVTLQFNSHKDHLRTITKFIIVPVVCDDECTDCDEVNE